jgi:NTE family protein
MTTAHNFDQDLIHHHIASYQRVALMLQGGGALGAYQVGVYQALTEAKLYPTWLCGISIGAINGAIMAGNAPDKSVDKLKEFWSTISSTDHGPMANIFSTWKTMTGGQNGFFQPHAMSPLLPASMIAGATSYYDTSALRKTLTRLIDFERLNSGDVRFSVGAVNVTSGQLVFFDNASETLTPEHIMASGALPPAFPMIEIDGEVYWDGGIVSNTPLEYLLAQEEDVSTLVFDVNVFSNSGARPELMPSVMTRQKDITYASRSASVIREYQRVLLLRKHLAGALGRLPQNELTKDEALLMHDYADAGVINLIRLTYQASSAEGDKKDYEFSKPILKNRMDAGYFDTLATLAHADWFEKPTAHDGVVSHGLHPA